MMMIMIIIIAQTKRSAPGRCHVQITFANRTQHNIDKSGDFFTLLSSANKDFAMQKHHQQHINCCPKREAVAQTVTQVFDIVAAVGAAATN